MLTAVKEMTAQAERTEYRCVITDRAAFDRIPAYKPQPDEPHMPILFVDVMDSITPSGSDAVRWDADRMRTLARMMGITAIPHLN
jgi:hypothetical protein